MATTQTPGTSIYAYFDLTATGADVLTWDDPVRGVWDNTTYLWAGDIATNISGYTTGVWFQRGRSSQIFDEIDAATGAVTLNNETRTFDPLYASSPYNGNIAPGKHVRIDCLGVTIFDGQIDDWNLDYDISGRSIAMMTLTDALGVLARQQFDEWTSTAGQLPGARLTSILDRSDVRWGAARDLDTGVNTLQADTVSWGSNVLNYCQLVARSDLGAFFCSREGLLTFRDRHANLLASPIVAFADDGTGVPFKGIATSFGSETYFNRVSVDAVGLTKQTVTTSTAVEDGIRSLSLDGLLMDSESQALDMATYLAETRSSGDPRISEIVVNLNTTQLTYTQIQTILTLELNNLITVTYTPNRVGTAINQTCVIQGIRHDIGPDWHDVTLTLGATDGRVPFVWDDATFGLWDSTSVWSF